LGLTRAGIGPDPRKIINNPSTKQLKGETKMKVKMFQMVTCNNCTDPEILQMAKRAELEAKRKKYTSLINQRYELITLMAWAEDAQAIQEQIQKLTVQINKLRCTI